MATRRGAQINTHAQIKHGRDEHSSRLCFICACVDLHPCSTMAVFHQLAEVLYSLAYGPFECCVRPLKAIKLTSVTLYSNQGNGREGLGWPV